MSGRERKQSILSKMISRSSNVPHSAPVALRRNFRNLSLTITRPQSISEDREEVGIIVFFSYDVNS